MVKNIYNDSFIIAPIYHLNIIFKLALSLYYYNREIYSMITSPGCIAEINSLFGTCINTKKITFYSK